MAESNQFVYKPQSERGGLAILLPSNIKGASVDIVDSNGNVIATGNNAGPSNGNRDTFRFDKPGNMYGEDISVQVSYGDESYTIPVGAGGTRYEGEGLNVESINPNPTGKGNVGGGYGGMTGGQYSPYINDQDFNNPFVVPQYLPFGGTAPFVDFQGATDYAYGIGQLNKDIYFGNVGGEQAKQTAMGLLQTDIEGIKTGAEQLVPMVRQQGDLDVQTNIARGQQLDQFNLQRLPQFNAANIKQAQQLSRAAQEMRTEQVQAAGLDYKGRITELLDQLREQSKGRLSSDLAAELDTATRNRGADIAAATGVSSISGAGVRAQDRLLIGEKLALQQQAQAQLPGVLTQAQSVLQAPEERAPGVYAQPTQIPLTVSNVQDRLPVQSSISAGQAQLGLGTAATQMQTISPSTILGSNLQTQQFNEQARYGNEIFNFENQSKYMNAVDNAYMNAIQQDKADDIRDQQYNMFQQGLDAQYSAQQARGESMQGGFVQGQAAATPQAGTLTNVPAPTPAQGAAIQTEYDLPNGNVLEVWDDGTTRERSPNGSYYATTRTPQNLGGATTGGALMQRPSGAPTYGNAQGDQGFLGQLASGASALGAIGSGLSGFISAGASAYDAVFGDGDGKITVNGNEVSQTSFKNWLADTAKEWTGYGQDREAQFNEPTSYKGEALTGNIADDEGNITGYVTESGIEVSREDALAYQRATGESKPSLYEQSTQALNNYGLDWGTLVDTGSTIANWGNMSTADKLVSTGNIGTGILVNKGILTEQEAKNISNFTGALGVLADPFASDAEKVAAIGNAGADLVVTSYTGSINQPTTINGNKVVGSVSTADGKEGFSVQKADGTYDVVAKSDLVTSSNVHSGINAFAVLTSNADKETKMTALTAIGIDASVANGIVSEVAGGNMLAALSVFDTARNWEDMNDMQKGVAVIKTGGAVFNAVSGTSSAWTNSAVESSSAIASSTAKTAAPATAGASAWGTLGNIIGGASVIAGGAMGAKTAYDTITKADDMSQSKSVKYATAGGISAGMGLGAAIATGGALMSGMALGATLGSSVPIVGTIVGAGVGALAGLAIGSTGTGKGSGQLMRDDWRSSMQNNGFLDKDYNVTLADGTKYDMGLDGNAKLTNLDGTSRHTYDIDWDNELATNSIPKGHLFNIATGLDPTGHQKFGTFDRATAQNVNAATSNAQSMEDVNANYLSMLEDAGVASEDLVMQLEVLRAQGKIDQEEYLVYLNATNEIYGTNIQPSDSQESRDYLISTLEAKGNNMSEYDRYVYNELTNPDRIDYWNYQRDKRKGKAVPKERVYLGMGKEFSAYKQYAKQRNAQVRG